GGPGRRGGDRRVADIEGVVLALVVIRLVVVRLADVGTAGGQLFSHVRQQNDPSAYYREIALMLVDQLRAFYGEAPSSMPKERELQGFAMAMASGVLGPAGVQPTASAPPSGRGLRLRRRRSGRGLPSPSASGSTPSCRTA